MRILIHSLTIGMFLSLSACMDFGLLAGQLGDAVDGLEQGLAGERGEFDEDDTAEDWDTAEDECEHRRDDRGRPRPPHGEDREGDCDEHEDDCEDEHEDDCEDGERPPRPHGPDCDEDDDDLDTADEDDEDEDEDYDEDEDEDDED